MRDKLWVVCFAFLLCLKVTASYAQTITATTATGAIIACAGTVSISPQIHQLAVSGSNLTEDDTAAAQTGFELSLDLASGYETGVTLTTSGTPGSVNTSYGTPSVPTSFTVTGTGLTAGITVTPPPGFEVSTDNINFSPTVTVGGPNAPGPFTIYIRLAATTNAGTYNGNIVLSSPGVTSVDVYMPNSVVSPAIINVTGTYEKLYGETATNFTLYYNTPGFTSNLQGLQNGNTFYSINFAFGDGAAPTDPVGIYPDAVTLSDFKGANGYLASNYTINYFPFDMDVLPAPLTITANNISKPYGTTLANVQSSTSFTVTGLQNNETAGTVSITYGTGASASSAPGVYTGSVVASDAAGGTFSPSNYAIAYQAGNITVAVPPPPVIAYTNQPAALQTIYGTPSLATSIQVTGANLTSGITVTPPAGFEVSVDNITFAGTITLTPNADGTVTTTIYIRLAATTAVGSYTNQDLVISSAGVENINVPLNGIVIPAPLTIAATPVTKTYGSILEGGAGSTALTATGLQNGETVGSVTLTCGAGSAASDPVGVYDGSLVPSAATGGTFNPSNYTINYPDTSITVVAAPLTIRADNASRLFATPNPTLTVTYTGFVNNDGPAQLTALPLVSTTAVLDSPIGEYPVTASDASSPDYTITYIAGTLTIYPSPQNIKIPNTFTPNGDGVNDVWNIGDLQFYPNCTVDVYTRWGRQLFQSRGYGQAWDGTYNGQPLPVGTYYYVIGLNDGTATRLSGYVVIIR